MTLLTVENLTVHFDTGQDTARAVDGVSFSVDAGETVGIVGESGCGKSVTGLSILRLIPMLPGKIVDGTITFRGQDLLTVPETSLRSLRGRAISLIFQEPMSSLNPVLTCGEQVREAIRAHEKVKPADLRRRVPELLATVGIPDPLQCAKAYPHQLSGGMRQRIMIAIALACKPDLLIADEPTTALDVTVQAQILELLRHLQEQFGMAILFISHDLGVIAETAHRILVMYAGQIVEQGTVRDLFHHPLHPYTRGLLASIPNARAGNRGPMAAIPGRVPAANHLPSGCRFHPRCPYNDGESCVEQDPGLPDSSWKHSGRCHYIRDTGGQLEFRPAEHLDQGGQEQT